MKRIALVDASAATEAAVRAALGDASVAACAAGAVPADAAVAIVDGTQAPALSRPVPTLLLVERGHRVPGSPFEILEKPFRASDLRDKVRALLDRSGVASANDAWLASPRLAASAVAALSAARRLGGAIWIVGENGTGAAQIAAALAVREGLEPAVWTAATAPVRSARALWAPDLERRPAADQHAFEQFLALEPQGLVVATSSCDPEEALASGRLTPTLHAALSRNSLRLPPLRERRGDLAPLARELLAAAAARLGLERAGLAADAAALVEACPWPGNVLELDAVLTRSLLARSAAGETVVELAPADLRFAPDHLAPFDVDAGAAAAAGAPAGTEAPRRAVVVPFVDAARRSADSASETGAQAAAVARVSTATRATDEAAVEALLAAFAHEIRNPMSTIKTFASLEAARATDDNRELASLAVEASARIDEQLEFLQRYAELAPDKAARVDLVEVLAEAGEAAGLEPEIAARRPVRANVDPALVRFVADALVAELRTRSGDRPPVVDAAAGRADAVTIMIVAAGAAGAAIDRLDRWVEGASLPWRLALARAAARRAGGDLEVDVEDGELRLLWRASSASGAEESEERKHDDQAGSPDRRRRSRGS